MAVAPGSIVEHLEVFEDVRLGEITCSVNLLSNSLLVQATEERFGKTALLEFYQVAFREKLYTGLDELQKDLDAWLMKYNEQRTHQGKMCCGRTPMETFDAGMAIWREKEIDATAA